MTLSDTVKPSLRATVRACIAWIDWYGLEGRLRDHHPKPPSLFWRADSSVMSRRTVASSSAGLARPSASKAPSTSRSAEMARMRLA